ncbi:MAG TPA: hypothetical protein VMR34_01335 [Candidatus Saccharimonadales bacterium]|nr:hypothetical protein [Candidatus Saccharimonadales bacterium]
MEQEPVIESVGDTSDNFVNCILVRMVENRVQGSDPSIHEGLVSEMIDKRGKLGMLLCDYIDCNVSCVVRDEGSTVRPVDTHGNCLRDIVRLRTAE